MVTGILDAYAEDIVERLAASGGPTPGASGANVHEIAEGEIFTDARVSIRAFIVPHAGWKHAFAYRIRTVDKVMVISGDVRANPAIARECNGCDILLHEVYSDTGFTTLTPVRQKYFAQAHTSATQLGDIATQARPGLLILYHQLFFGASDSTLVAEVRSRFSGRVVSAKDLDKFQLSNREATAKVFRPLQSILFQAKALRDRSLGSRSRQHRRSQSSDVERTGIRIDNLAIQSTTEIQRFMRPLRHDFAATHHIDQICVHDLTDVV